MLYLFVFLAGVLLHVVVFSRHEWDRHAPSVVLSAYGLYAAAVALLIVKGDLPFGEAVAKAFVLEAVLLSGFIGSMIIYRQFLHPLRSIPGPLAARLISLWIIKENVPDLKFYVKLRNLHDQYGDFVRIRKC
jgi:hypothetical protein